MKLIDRYIGREVLLTTLFGVAVLTFVLVLGNLFKQLLDQLVTHGVPLEIILSAMAYIIPFSLTYTIPWGFLTAVLLVFGKLSGENELTAFRSCGVSITRMCAPLLCISLVCVAICLWINLDVAPRAQDKMKGTMVRIATENPMSLFSSDHVIDDFPGKKIYVENKDGRELKNILVYEMDKDSNVVRMISAKKGELETKNMEMLLHIYDARFEQRDPDSPGDWNKIHEGIVMKETVFSISLQDLYEKNRRWKMPSQSSPMELWREAQATKAESQTPFTRLKLTLLMTELSKRVAYSMASFALALIAVPLAITAHRKETSIGFLLSFVVALFYFFFTRLGEMELLRPELHPEFLVWIPNIVFIGFGGFLFRGLARK